MSLCKGSGSSAEESNFYLNYPSKKAAPEFHETCEGCFEDLDFYCLLGYDRASVNTKVLVQDANGLFDWEGTKRFTQRWQGTEVESKRFVLVDYLIEVVYDVAMAPEDNVSESAGFEIYMRSDRTT